MLAAALDNEDTLYWELEVEKPPSPKSKWPQVEEESVNDSILTVQTAMSVKKTPNQLSKVLWQQLLKQKPKQDSKVTLRLSDCK